MKRIALTFTVVVLLAYSIHRFHLPPPPTFHAPTYEFADYFSQFANCVPLEQQVPDAKLMPNGTLLLPARTIYLTATPCPWSEGSIDLSKAIAIYYSFHR